MATKSKRAIITWETEDGEPPLGIWGGAPLPVPTPPIYYPEPPLGIWPSPGHPAHPIVLPPDNPGEPPNVIWPSPGHPAHPIAPGEPPLGIWGGAPLPVPTPPIYWPPIIWPQPPEGGPPIAIDPGHPEHPIVLPPIDAKPEHPIVIPLPPEIWPKPGVPTHPIVIPPDETPDKPKLINWYVGWSDKHGWVVVGVPNVPHPVPSKAGGPGGPGGAKKP
jgi:hypothetical protein